MNKIFKVKRSLNGLSTVTSELAKSNCVTAILGLSLVVNVAHADLTNTTNPFQATQQTGETASGYQAQTHNTNTVANGFLTNAFAAGSIAIGAEAGASGSGLLPNESSTLVNTGKEINRINTELSQINTAEYATVSPISMETEYNSLFFIDYEKSKAGNIVYKPVTTSQDFLAHTNLVKTTESALSNLSNAYNSLKSAFDELSADETNEEAKNQALQSLNTLKVELEANKPLLLDNTLSSYFASLDESIKLLSGAVSADVVEQAKRPTDTFNSPVLEYGSLEAIASNIFNFTMQVDGVSTTSVRDEIVDVAKAYSPATDDATGTQLKSALDRMQAISATGNVADLYNSLPTELKQMLANGEYSGTVGADSDNVLNILGIGKIAYLKSLADYMQANNITDSIAAFNKQVVKSYLSAQGIIGEDESSYITRFEKSVNDYLVANKEAIAKRAALEAEKNKVLTDFADIAKKLGYDNPAPDQIQDILGALTPDAIAIGHKSYTSGGAAVGIGANSVVTGANAVSIGADNNVFAENVTALGANIGIAKDAPVGSVVLGYSSDIATPTPTASMTIKEKTYNFVGTNPTSAVSVGSVGNERQVKNVAAGEIAATSTDAINGSQLYAVAEAVNTLEGKTATVSTKNPNLTVTPVTTATGTDYEIGLKPTLSGIDKIGNTGAAITFEPNAINVGGVKVTNVAAPTAETDAANKGYVDDVMRDATKGLKNKVTVTAGNGISVTSSQKTENDFTVTDYVVSVSEALIAQINAKGNAGISGGDNVVAGKNIIVTKEDGASGAKNATVSLDRDIEVDSAKIGNVTISGDKVDFGGNAIANVGEGKQPTDAVNLAQLLASKSTVESGSDSVRVETTRKPDGSSTYNVDLSDKTKATINKVERGLNVKTDDGKTRNYQLGSEVSVVGDGKNISTLATEDGVQVKLADDAVFNTVKTIKPAEISATSREVVQGSQLHQTNKQVNQNAQNIKKLSDKVDRNQKQMRRGVAASAAMGILPQPHLNGHSMVSAATTHYRGEQAIAVGYSRLSDNGRHIIKLSGASNVSGAKEAIVGASYGYQW